jgi:hypothetical protein
LIVSVKSADDCAGAAGAAVGFCRRFSASAMELAVCLDFPLVSGAADGFDRALEEITKRRRAGAFFVPLLD